MDYNDKELEQVLSLEKEILKHASKVTFDNANQEMKELFGHYTTYSDNKKIQVDGNKIGSGYRFHSIDFGSYAVSTWGPYGEAILYYDGYDFLSGVSSMGGLYPLVKYHFIGKKLYLYFLVGDRWQLHPIHNKGSIYLFKESVNF
jgi:hypothetical protein